MSDTWLQNIKVGDKIIIESSNPFSSDQIGTVARLTKTQIMTFSGARFRRDNGRQVGQGMYSSYLKQATNERCEKIREKTKIHTLVFKIEQASWKKLSLQKLQKIWKIIEEED